METHSDFTYISIYSDINIFLSFNNGFKSIEFIISSINDNMSLIY